MKAIQGWCVFIPLGSTSLNSSGDRSVVDILYLDSMGRTGLPSMVKAGHHYEFKLHLVVMGSPHLWGRLADSWKPGTKHLVHGCEGADDSVNSRALQVKYRIVQPV